MNQEAVRNTFVDKNPGVSSQQSEHPLPRWLEWAREIQALAQTGLQYSANDYQRARYVRLNEIAAEIFSEYSSLEYEPLADLFNQQIGYATPRVDVRAAVFKGDQLLLVRERSDGGWTFPGGWADVGDVPSRAAEREVHEESGFVVRACKIVGVYDANRVVPFEIFHAFKIIFLCELIGGEAQTSSETSEVAFFTLDEIPHWLSSERTQPRQILDAFKAHYNPDIETVFD